MELHLGLALSSSSSTASSNSSHQLDLNCITNESMIPVHHSKKRNHVPQTLPLLVWNTFCNKNKFNQDHDVDVELEIDDDGDNEVQSNSIFVRERNDDGVVGWPPVKICRRKHCDPKISNGGGGGQDDGGGSKSMYVKVHMEGIGIARKVDLNLHNSYETLVHTLADMFQKSYENVELTYEDKEGDWLLAGDVPWGSFTATVQRLKLLRK